MFSFCCNNFFVINVILDEPTVFCDINNLKGIFVNYKGMKILYFNFEKVSPRFVLTSQMFHQVKL